MVISSITSSYGTNTISSVTRGPLLVGFKVWGLGFTVWGLGFRV